MKSYSVVKVGAIQAYADGLLGANELAELADTSMGNVILPVREPRRPHSGSEKNATRGHTSASLVPHEVSPPRINAVGLVAARPSDWTIAVRSKSKLPSRDAFAPYLGCNFSPPI